jgi:predicted nuclease of restriction endonuclease-like (RecB) superfamily
VQALLALLFGHVLQCMRQFHETYKDDPNLSAVLREISWTHHLEILRCTSSEEREFYLKLTRKHGWSYRVLSHHIDSRHWKTNILWSIVAL